MIEIIPAIDIIGGKCVRLEQGDYNKMKSYHEDPLEVAKSFENAGIRRLHLVDLDGAKSSHIVNYPVLEKIAAKTRLVIDFGGGVKSDEDIRIAFESGASMVTGGSIAVKEPEIFKGWLATYGAEKMILGADVREKKIAVSGWKEQTGLDIFKYMGDYAKAGIQKVICTDIAHDGMLKGPSLDLYQEILEKIPGIYLIASGGVSSVKDIDRLEEANIPAVIFGKALYEGKITLNELSKYLS